MIYILELQETEKLSQAYVKFKQQFTLNISAFFMKVDNNRYMSRPAGLPKTGGRTKGTPNKNRTDLVEAIAIQGIDIPKKIVEVLNSLNPEKQANFLVGLMPYIYTKAKGDVTNITVNNVQNSDDSITITDEENPLLNMSLEEEIKIYEAALKLKKKQLLSA